MSRTGMRPGRLSIHESSQISAWAVGKARRQAHGMSRTGTRPVQPSHHQAITPTQLLARPPAAPPLKCCHTAAQPAEAAPPGGALAPGAHSKAVGGVPQVPLSWSPECGTGCPTLSWSTHWWSTLAGWGACCRQRSGLSTASRRSPSSSGSADRRCKRGSERTARCGPTALDGLAV
eukprot:364325-Chlamydomonas_euryale.AAC.11